MGRLDIREAPHSPWVHASVMANLLLDLSKASTLCFFKIGKREESKIWFVNSIFVNKLQHKHCWCMFEKVSKIMKRKISHFFNYRYIGICLNIIEKNYYYYYCQASLHIIKDLRPQWWSACSPSTLPIRVWIPLRVQFLFCEIGWN